MSRLAQNLQKIKESLRPNVQLVAVSKTKPVELLMEAYKQGQRIFGENKAMELIEKAEQMPKDIEWHFIGHLQRNKVKALLPHTALIHGVDSPRLFWEIQKRALDFEKQQHIFLQVHIAEESTKFGFSEVELVEFLKEIVSKDTSNIVVCGLMGMATFTEDQEQVRREFKKLKSLFDNVQSSYFKSNPSFKDLSMGMSGDYLLAMEEGSTVVRIGSSIFGGRQ
jgi:PLP dependent protein